jgi:hypothetical protein
VKPGHAYAMIGGTLALQIAAFVRFPSTILALSMAANAGCLGFCIGLSMKRMLLADQWEAMCGRAAKQASDLRIETERLREALELFAKIDVDFIAKDEPFRALIFKARAALEGK